MQRHVRLLSRGSSDPDTDDVTIRRLNAAYLNAARDAVRANRHCGMLRYGLSPEVADWLETATPEMLAELAERSTALIEVRFRGNLAEDTEAGRLLDMLGAAASPRGRPA